MSRRSKREHAPATFRERAAGLSPSLQRVALFIDQYPLDALTKSAAEIGRAVGTSDATIIRTIQALGYRGLAEFRDAIREGIRGREGASGNFSRTIADMKGGVEAAMDAVISTNLEAASNLRTDAARAQLSAGIDLLARGQRIVVFGLGPSAPLAQYVVLNLERSGRPATSLTRSGQALADDLLSLRTDDVVLMLAYGRSYAEAGATLMEARRLRIPIVLLTDSLEERLAQHADVVIHVLRGQAQKVALHGATFICLEAMVLGLSAKDVKRAMAGFDRLATLRRSVSGEWSGLVDRTPRSRSA